MVVFSKYVSRVKTGLVLGALGVLASAGAASAASTVTVDGVKKAGEYTGGVESGSKSLLWFNGHESIYTEAANNQNPLYYEIDGSGSDWMLNMFFEVPTYARRMYWEDGCSATGIGSSSGCSTGANANGFDTEKYLDTYFTGTHHSSANMSYHTQTDSEFFELLGTTNVKTKWQAEDGNGLSDGFTWATSREYLIANSPVCSTTACFELNKTSSIELKWSGLASQAAAKAIFDGVEKMELHLSDEARGLDDCCEVPEIDAAAGMGSLAALGAMLAFVRSRRRYAA